MTLRKPAILSAALLAAAALLALAAEPAAQALMVHQIDQALAAPPFTKAEHGAIRYALWRGRLEIERLAFETTAPALRALAAERVVAEGVKPGYLLGGVGSEIRLASVSAQKLQLKAEDKSASIARLAADDLVIAADPLTATFGMEAVSARRIEMADVCFEADAAGLALAYASFEGEGLDHGRLATLSARDLSMLARTAAGTVRTEAAEMDLAGVNYRALSAAAAADGETLLPVLERLSASQLTSATADGKLTAEALALAGLKARPGLLSPTQPSPTSRALLAGIGLDSAEMTMAVYVPAANPAARVSFGRIALKELRPGRLGALSLEQTAINGPEGVGRLATLELEDLTYGAEGPPLAIERLRLGDLTAGMKAGAEVSVKQAVLALDGPAARPLGGTIALTGVTVPATALPLLMRAGYNELTLDYEGHSSFDTQRAAVGATQRLSAKDAGSFNLSMQLSNYPTAFDWRESMQAMLKFMALRLDSLELRYDDDSLVERLIKAHASETGRDVPAVREELLRVVAAQRQAFADKPALLASLDAIAAFLRQPGTLTLTLSPPEPVSLGTLMTLSRSNPSAALDALGLSIH